MIWITHNQHKYYMWYSLSLSIDLVAQSLTGFRCTYGFSYTWILTNSGYMWTYITNRKIQAIRTQILFYHMYNNSHVHQLICTTRKYFRFICKDSNVHLINFFGTFANYNIYMVKNCNFKSYLCVHYTMYTNISVHVYNSSHVH